MTSLLALVRTPGEAAAALAAGADEAAVVVARVPLADPERADPRVGWLVELDAGSPLSAADLPVGHPDSPLWLPLAAAWASAISAALAGRRRVVGCIDADSQPVAAQVAKARDLGLTEVLVATTPFAARRLLDACPIADLSTLARQCRDEDLRFGFAGAIEWPDVPRLRALAPDVIGFDTGLRDLADKFDPVRVSELREALNDRGSGARGGPRAGQQFDRIFVRDWTVPMSIGAYARERGRSQRVRFGVVAEVVRDAGGTGLGGIVSYDLITDAIARLAADHIDLVEDLAERLAALVSVEPRIVSLDITVEKLDVGPGSVGCRIFRRRGTV